MNSWHVVICKSRQEAVAEENLVRQGFEVYLPRIRTRHRRRGKWIETVGALFPRYLFIRIDPDTCNTAPVRSTRGATGLLRFGVTPAIVPDNAIETILRHEDAALGMRLDTRPAFQAGEAILLLDGPFAGIEGVFAEEDGEKRVIVLLDLLGKSNKLRVNRDWVAKAA